MDDRTLSPDPNHKARKHTTAKAMGKSWRRGSEHANAASTYGWSQQNVFGHLRKHEGATKEQRMKLECSFRYHKVTHLIN